MFRRPSALAFRRRFEPEPAIHISLTQSTAMRREHPVPKSDTQPSAALPRDESRIEMMRRAKAMSVEERIELFERLSRDAAWARSATRIR
jgi:hypothetical protein